MNILPKKRWHVRNKDNVARVRRDEAKAKEEEEEREKRHLFAEQEARTNILRHRARVQHVEKDVELEDYTGHINFFQDIEEGKVDIKVNAEHEAEKKADQEKQEKRIGLLTYLGQSVLENKDKPWHNMSKTERERVDEIRALRSEPLKNLLDPLGQMRKQVAETKKFQEQAEVGIALVSQQKAAARDHITTTNVSFPMVAEAIRRDRKRKHKHNSKKDKKKRDKKHKHKRHSSRSEHEHKDNLESPTSGADASDDDDTLVKRRKLEIMRQQRLKRERDERERAQKLIAEREGNASVHETNKAAHSGQRYNSQFHPELARQTRNMQSRSSY